MLVAKLGAHRIPRFGEVVELELDIDSIHLFDPASGSSLLKKEGGAMNVHQEYNRPLRSWRCWRPCFAWNGEP
jgi:hypothetical protein